MLTSQISEDMPDASIYVLLILSFLLIANFLFLYAVLYKDCRVFAIVGDEKPSGLYISFFGLHYIFMQLINKCFFLLH